MPRGGRRANQTGRPVTVGATADVHVYLSPEMMATLREKARAKHVSMSEAVRLVMQIAIDSPGDFWAAAEADPGATRTEFVLRRVEKKARAAS